ncbi:hypothetical protein M9H77_06977 [Catharanthus roseus]|uniref:Uncharacterized protein n=1 Tax=Catharanthus roseus TaxID=4058 RepID=A0ACC0BTL5_CATRO|nr:hypothetical protein M9H77_06977 [Catharanthus roseus]
MAYSKLTRARSNCYKDRDYGGNAYGGCHHRNGNFTHRSRLSRESERDERSKEKKSEFEISEQERGNESIMENQGRYKEEQHEREIIRRRIFSKEGVDVMTQDRHENMESFQGSVMRSRARKIKEETQRINLGTV